MQLVIGLGNPGSRYATTRHNLGFRIVDALAQRVDVRFSRDHRDYDAAEFLAPFGRVVLLKPMTYMNLSGRALLAWREAMPGDEAPASLLVVCDDIQLPLGTVRLRAGGSAGGQNGLASLIEAHGSEELPRLRLGVGPRDDDLDPSAWADFVLADFAPDEQEAVDDLVARGVAAVLDCLQMGPRAAGSRHNRRPPAAAG